MIRTTFATPRSRSTPQLLRRRCHRPPATVGLRRSVGRRRSLSGPERQERTKRTKNMQTETATKSEQEQQANMLRYDNNIKRRSSTRAVEKNMNRYRCRSSASGVVGLLLRGYPTLALLSYAVPKGRAKLSHMRLID